MAELEICGTAPEENWFCIGPAESGVFDATGKTSVCGDWSKGEEKAGGNDSTDFWGTEYDGWKTESVCVDVSEEWSEEEESTALEEWPPG